MRGTVYANAGWFKGALILGSATAINTGTGLYAADVSGTWKFRLGTATGSRIEWSGTAFTIYGSDGSVQLSSGAGLPWDKISSRPSDSELLNSNQQWSDISGASDLGNLIPDVDFADSSWGAFSGDWAKGAPTTINVPTAIIRWITSSKTAAAGTNYLGADRFTDGHKFHVNPGETLYYSARSATQSTATTGTWDMALLFYDKNLLPVTGTEWNDRLQFSVPSAGEQSKSGSTIVPAGAAYAAFRTRRGSVVNAGTATGWCEMGQIRVSRTQDGATVGADWSSNVSNIPYDTVYNNDDSVALGFNPTFSDWPTGDARPTGWDAWNTGPTKETTIKRVGEFSAKFTPNGTSDYGMSRTVTWDAAPLPAGTFVSGTVDIYLAATPGRVSLGFALNYSLPQAWRQPISRTFPFHLPLREYGNGAIHGSCPIWCPDLRNANLCVRKLRFSMPSITAHGPGLSISTTCGSHSSILRLTTRRSASRSLATITR